MRKISIKKTIFLKPLKPPKIKRIICHRKRLKRIADIDTYENYNLQNVFDDLKHIQVLLTGMML